MVSLSNPPLRQNSICEVGTTLSDSSFEVKLTNIYKSDKVVEKTNTEHLQRKGPEMNLKIDEQQKCVAARLIPITGDISHHTFEDTGSIIKDLLSMGAPDIKVIISSNGGDVDFGLHIYDLISTYPGRSTGIVYCKADSMAATILQGCDVRLCAKHASVFIHHISRNSVSFDILKDGSRKKLEKLKADMLRLQKLIYATLAERSKKSVEEIRKACSGKTRMDANTALEFGLVDRVLTRTDMANMFRPEIISSIIGKTT